MILKINNISLGFGEKIILKNLSYELNSGQLLIINGNNGEGKTSLLKALAGLMILQSGSISCAEYDIYDNFNDYVYDYTYIPSENILDSEFTVEYYLNFWTKLSNNTELTKSAINYFHFKNLLNHQISQISSGWKKRVLLAKLLIDNKIIWLLDEPFNFLDTDGYNLLVNMINSRLLSGGIVALTTNKIINEFKEAKFLNLNEINK